MVNAPITLWCVSCVLQTDRNVALGYTARVSSPVRAIPWSLGICIKSGDDLHFIYIAAIVR